MALLNKTKTGKGQMIDMALYEAVFNMMEGVIPDYSALGLVRQPSGFNLPDIVPSMTCTTQEEALKALGEAGCPSGPIYDAADMMNDPHFNARGMFEEITTPTGLTFKIPALVPKLSETPGNTEWCGPEVGAHTSQVLRDYLGWENEKI